MGDVIASDSASVAAVIEPIISALDPAVGPLVVLAFRVFAVAEPAAYNALAALLGGSNLTPAQIAAVQAVEASLANPDSYLS